MPFLTSSNFVAGRPQPPARATGWNPQARAILQIIFDGYGDDEADSRPLIIAVVPRSMKIHRNGYNQADSWEMTFDVGDLPIDPHLIRSAAAELYLFHTEQQGDSTRVTGRQLTELERPDDYDVHAGVARDLGLTKDRFTLDNRPIIYGIVDDDGVDLDEGGKWVTMQGQDYTALLAAKQWPPLPNGRPRRIPVGKRLDRFVDEVLQMAEPDGRLRAAVRWVKPEDLPVVGAHEVKGNKRGIPIEEDTTCWDVIYKVCTRHGFIVFVEGLEVVIARPRNADGGDPTRVRRMAFGKNLSNLHLGRKLGAKKAPTVVVKSYDPVARKTITAEWPPNGLERSKGRTKAGTSLSKSEFGKSNTATTRHRTPPKTKSKTKRLPAIHQSEEFDISTVRAGVPPDQLLELAKARHHVLGREERTVVFSTMDLEDLDGRPMLEAYSGDTIQVEWDDFNREMLQNPSIPLGEKVQRLLDKGYNQVVAEEIASRYDALRALDRPLYMREATIEYDVDGGVEIEQEALDFIVPEDAREDDYHETRETIRDERLRRPDGSRPGAKQAAHARGSRR